MTDFSTGEAAAAPALSSVFGELNKGENVTAGRSRVCEFVCVLRE